MTGEIDTRAPSPLRLRQAAIAVAAVAGAGVGILLGLAWRLASSGERDLALVVLVAAVLITSSVFFLLLQARAIAALLDLRNHADASISSRLTALEAHLPARNRIGSDAAG